MPQNTEGRPQEAFFSRQRKQVLESLKALEAADNPFLHTGVQAVTAGLKGDYRLRVGNLRVPLTPDEKKTSSSRLHNLATGESLLKQAWLSASHRTFIRAAGCPEFLEGRD